MPEYKQLCFELAEKLDELNCHYNVPNQSAMIERAYAVLARWGNHPITPPDELVREWIDNDDFPFSTGTFDLVSITKDRLCSIAAQSARWGADQELEACCEWLISNQNPRWAAALQEGRRPKPPSLKEQALAKLEAMERLWEANGNTSSDLVRRAIESLPD